MTTISATAIADRFEPQACTRWIMALASAHGQTRDATRLFARWEHATRAHIALLEKALVEPITTASGLAPQDPLTGEWLELYRRTSLIGRLREAGARQVPANTSIPIETGGGGLASWVQEATGIPLSQGAVGSTVLDSTKLAILAVLSEDLVRLTTTDAVAFVERFLARAIDTAEAIYLLDAQAPAPQVRPAGLLYQVTASASGSSVEDDLAALVGDVRGGNPVNPIFITSVASAMNLARERSTGNRVFPGISVVGGELMGVPVLISQAAGANLYLVDLDSLLIADSGISFASGRHAAVQMTDAPVAGPQPLTSMFQSNSVAIRAIRYLSWQKGYSDTVGYMTVEAPA